MAERLIFVGNPEDIDFIDRCFATEDLVRCRDCKYWQDNNNGYPHPDCKWRQDETPDPNDYCSFDEVMQE